MPAPGAQITYQANLDRARHNWLHLTPAYAADYVADILSAYDHNAHVFDPFVGSGTSVIQASQMGFRSSGCDINPFLIDLVRAKSTNLDVESCAELESLIHKCAQEHLSSDQLCADVAMHNVDRWWLPDDRMRLRIIKSHILSVDCSAALKRILRCAFAVAVKASARVNHKHHSLSFSDQDSGCKITQTFIDAAQQFKHDCSIPMAKTPHVFLQDARDAALQEGVDVLVTSPPYPNRMSYMRELRPYLYWLDYVNEAHECADMDWHAIGGTWGTATNRLKTWTSADERYLVPSVLNCIEALPEQGSSEIIKTYLKRYAHDMFQHVQAVRHILNPGARLHYVIGNANYYGVNFASDQLMRELLASCQYQDIEVQELRRRSSSKALFEYCISASAPRFCCK